jgi:hypothetical protein
VKPDPDSQRVRKRRNRWGPADENKAAGLMGLPTAILSNMTQEQKEAYVLHLRIEEISQKLRIDDVVPSDNRYVALAMLLAIQRINSQQLSIACSCLRQFRST